MARDGLERDFFLDYHLNADDQFRVEDGDDVFCIRIATPSTLRESGYDEFLILRRKSGPVGVFERIGLMMLGSEGMEFCRLFDSKREECAITIV